jgi:malonyl CoA-acyl carrier protein transacylase
MTRKTAVVICPGRGTYTKSELGYLTRNFSDRALLSTFDGMRARLGQETLSTLDGAAAYTVSRHTRGDNASTLIYASTLGDFRAIDPSRIEVVAITGNSMGWYSALACGGALTAEGGFELVNSMGALMQESLIGGQTIYPFVGEEWAPDLARKADLMALVEKIGTRPGHQLFLSINLGGMLVVAGNEEGLRAFEASVPPAQGRFPLRLQNHAAFHSALQAPVADRGRALLSASLFCQPKYPIVDGRGVIWWPGATNSGSLWDYTLGHQVTEPYDFTAAIRIAAREFAPDLFIITGPGTTLGGAVVQSLILANWRNMGSKADFQKLQQTAPFLVAVGMEEQRSTVTRMETDDLAIDPVRA